MANASSTAFYSPKENVEPPGNQSYNANAFQAELTERRMDYEF